MKAPHKHFIGGAVYLTRGQQCNMGRGWAVCCSGDRAYSINRNGTGTFDEQSVTCPRCLSIMARRIKPGAIGVAMGIPLPPAPAAKGGAP